MPKLDWIGKQAVINYHQSIPFHLLRENPTLSFGVQSSGNLLIEGDNLTALKALLPTYGGMVKCIYIDPPYNTGAEGWVYNDSVNSPEIKDWLGKVVGGEFEDLSRHDKWLCMMYPRLMLLRDFLRNDGVIFVSIDEYELAHLRLLMDEIFGLRNDLGCLVWKRRNSSALGDIPLSIDHEYILVFARDRSRVKLHGVLTGIGKYPYIDERGSYASTDLTVGMSKEDRPGQYYPITNPRTGKTYFPSNDRVWRFFPESMQKVIDAELIIWPDDQPGNRRRPRYKTYYDPTTTKPKPISSWIESLRSDKADSPKGDNESKVAILATGMNQDGGRVLQKIFGRRVFSYPKPLSLIKELLRASTSGSDIILDSFAGSCTTGHAVLDLNKDDGGNRRFIAIEMEKEIARDIACERLKRVISGFTWTDSGGNQRIEVGLGGGFIYESVGPSLLDNTGQISSEITYRELARVIFFTETRCPITEPIDELNPFLGYKDGLGIYLLPFKDKVGNGHGDSSILSRTALRQLAQFSGTRVIYASGCLLSPQALAHENIIFKQLPYDLRVI